MQNKLPDFSNVRVLVVGDVMLDRYWTGSIKRISPEAAVPVVHMPSPVEPDDRLGGAANVAANLTALGAQCTLCAITGDDSDADIMQKLLKQKNIDFQLIRSNNTPTIVKLRITHQNQHVLRVDFEKTFPDEHAAELKDSALKQLSKVDIVVLSDYAKGSLAYVDTIIASARALDLPVLVDPKGDDFSGYSNATLITPNEKEFNAIADHPCSNNEEFETQGRIVRLKLGLEALLITRGEHGMTLIQDDKVGGEKNLHLPTKAHEVFDVVGAGDTVISTLAVAMGAGMDISEATELANYAAGVAVSHPGTVSVGYTELENILQGKKGLIPLEELLNKLGQMPKSKKIVFTNGCFDLIHSGHVSYLNQAKQLGDILVIALNSDASIKRLKGNNRPIVSLNERARVIAELRCVDWVVSFDEDTPENLLEKIKPHILVKGGDYADTSEVVGHEIVQGYGGEVQVLNKIEGMSTTALIDQILNTEDTS